MQLLCIGNGIFTKKSGKLLTHRLTGNFLIELTDYFEKVTFVQAAYNTSCLKTLNNFELNNEKLEALAFELSEKNSLAKCFSYLKSIPAILHQVRKADFLYIFLPGNLSMLISICAIILKKPYGIYLRGEHGFNRKLMSLILSKSNFVHANGQILADKVSRFCKNVDLTIPMLDLTDSDCFTHRNFKNQPPWNILYVGRIETRKGIHELIEAARIIKEQAIDFELNIVGEGPELEKLMTESPAELGQHVRYLGLISDRDKLFSLYMNADLFVFPSHEEGFPRVLYEAMAFQVPIITTFVGSIGSIMQHEDNCLRVDVGDSKMIALTIERALNNIQLRQKIAGNAGNVVRQILKRKNESSHAKQVHQKVSKYENTK